MSEISNPVSVVPAHPVPIVPDPVSVVPAHPVPIVPDPVSVVPAHPVPIVPDPVMDDSRFEALLSQYESLKASQNDTGDWECVVEAVNSLFEAWKVFSTALENNRMSNPLNCFYSIWRHTAELLLDETYYKKVEQQTKSKISDCIQTVEMKQCLEEPMKTMCSTLTVISKEPWQCDTVMNVLSIDIMSLEPDAIEKLWVAEGWGLLDIRMEKIGMQKRKANNEMVAKLVYTCLIKGKDWWTNSSSCQNAPTSFDPYRYPYEKYLEFLEVYLLLWNKQIVDTELLSTIPPEICTHLIKRLREKELNGQCGRLLPTMWTHLHKVYSRFAKTMIPYIFSTDHDPVQVEELLELLFEVELDKIKGDHNEKLEKIVRSALAERVEVCCGDYLFSLAEIYLKKADYNEKSRELFLKVFMKAIFIDLNALNKLREANAERHIKTEQVRAKSIKFSKRFLQLSEFFKEFPVTSRELRLTAFSLNPTQELFEKIFPTVPSVINNQNTASLTDIGDSLVPEPQNLTNQGNLDISDANNTRSPEENSKNEIVTEDLRLPMGLSEDVDTAIKLPRWSALVHSEEAETKSLCIKLLEKGDEYLIAEKELEYAKPDEALYQLHKPQDDGRKKVKRAFNSKIKKNVKLGRPRSTQKGVSLTRGNKRAKPFKKLQNKSSFGKGIRNKNGLIPAEGLHKTEDMKIKLGKLSAFVRQCEQIKNYLTVSDKLDKFKGVCKKAREAYKLKYLREKMNLPGPFQLVPNPKAYKVPTNSKLDVKDPSRPDPTGYVPPSTPYHLRQQSLGNFDVDFRFNRNSMTTKFLEVADKKGENISPESRSKITGVEFAKVSAENFHPGSKDEGWRNTGKAYCRKLSATTGPLMQKQLLDLKNWKANLDPCALGRHSQSMKELSENTVKYNNLKEESSKSILTRTPGPPTEVSTKCRLKKGIVISQPVSLTSSSEGKLNDTAGFNDFAIGEVWEFELVTKKIVLPKCPKTKKEKLFKETMIQHSIERVKHNLETKSYAWESVQVPYAAELISRHGPTPSVPARAQEPRVFGPLTEEQMANIEKLNSEPQPSSSSMEGLVRLQAESSHPLPLDRCNITGDVVVPVQGQTIHLFQNASTKTGSGHQKSNGFSHPRNTPRKRKAKSDLSVSGVSQSDVNPALPTCETDKEAHNMFTTPLSESGASTGLSPADKRTSLSRIDSSMEVSSAAEDSCCSESSGAGAGLSIRRRRGEKVPEELKKRILDDIVYLKMKRGEAAKKHGISYPCVSTLVKEKIPDDMEKLGISLEDVAIKYGVPDHMASDAVKQRIQRDIIKHKIPLEQTAKKYGINGLWISNVVKELIWDDMTKRGVSLEISAKLYGLSDVWISENFKRENNNWEDLPVRLLKDNPKEAETEKPTGFEDISPAEVSEPPKDDPKPSDNNKVINDTEEVKKPSNCKISIPYINSISLLNLGGLVAGKPIESLVCSKDLNEGKPADSDVAVDRPTTVFALETTDDASKFGIPNPLKRKAVEVDEACDQQNLNKKVCQDESVNMVPHSQPQKIRGLKYLTEEAAKGSVEESTTSQSVISDERIPKVSDEIQNHCSGTAAPSSDNGALAAKPATTVIESSVNVEAVVSCGMEETESPSLTAKAAIDSEKAESNSLDTQTAEPIPVEAVDLEKAESTSLTAKAAIDSKKAESNSLDTQTAEPIPVVAVDLETAESTSLTAKAAIDSEKAESNSLDTQTAEPIPVVAVDLEKAESTSLAAINSETPDGPSIKSSYVEEVTVGNSASEKPDDRKVTLKINRKRRATKNKKKLKKQTSKNVVQCASSLDTQELIITPVNEAAVSLKQNGTPEEEPNSLEMHDDSLNNKAEENEISPLSPNANNANEKSIENPEKSQPLELDTNGPEVNATEYITATKQYGEVTSSDTANTEPSYLTEIPISETPVEDIISFVHNPKKRSRCRSRSVPSSSKSDEKSSLQLEDGKSVKPKQKHLFVNKSQSSGPSSTCSVLSSSSLSDKDHSLLKKFGIHDSFVKLQLPKNSNPSCECRAIIPILQQQNGPIFGCECSRNQEINRTEIEPKRSSRLQGKERLSFRNGLPEKIPTENCRELNPPLVSNGENGRIKRRQQNKQKAEHHSTRNYDESSDFIGQKDTHNSVNIDRKKFLHTRKTTDAIVISQKVSKARAQDKLNIKTRTNLICRKLTENEEPTLKPTGFHSVARKVTCQKSEISSNKMGSKEPAQKYKTSQSVARKRTRQRPQIKDITKDKFKIKNSKCNHNRNYQLSGSDINDASDDTDLSLSSDSDYVPPEVTDEDEITDADDLEGPREQVAFSVSSNVSHKKVSLPQSISNTQASRKLKAFSCNQQLNKSSSVSLVSGKSLKLPFRQSQSVTKGRYIPRPLSKDPLAVGPTADSPGSPEIIEISDSETEMETAISVSTSSEQDGETILGGGPEEEDPEEFILGLECESPDRPHEYESQEILLEYEPQNRPPQLDNVSVISVYLGAHNGIYEPPNITTSAAENSNPEHDQSITTRVVAPGTVGISPRQQPYPEEPARGLTTTDDSALYAESSNLENNQLILGDVDLPVTTGMDQIQQPYPAKPLISPPSITDSALNAGKSDSDNDHYITDNVDPPVATEIGLNQQPSPVEPAIPLLSITDSVLNAVNSDSNNGHHIIGKADTSTGLVQQPYPAEPIIIPPSITDSALNSENSDSDNHHTIDNVDPPVATETSLAQQASPIEPITSSPSITDSVLNPENSDSDNDHHTIDNVDPPVATETGLTQQASPIEPIISSPSIIDPVLNNPENSDSDNDHHTIDNVDPPVATETSLAQKASPIEPITSSPSITDSVLNPENTDSDNDHHTIDNVDPPVATETGLAQQASPIEPIISSPSITDSVLNPENSDSDNDHHTIDNVDPPVATETSLAQQASPIEPITSSPSITDSVLNPENSDSDNDHHTIIDNVDPPVATETGLAQQASPIEPIISSPSITDSALNPENSDSNNGHHIIGNAGPKIMQRIGQIQPPYPIEPVIGLLLINESSLNADDGASENDQQIKDKLEPPLTMEIGEVEPSYSVEPVKGLTSVDEVTRTSADVNSETDCTGQESGVRDDQHHAFNEFEEFEEDPNSNSEPSEEDTQSNTNEATEEEEEEEESPSFSPITEHGVSTPASLYKYIPNTGPSQSPSKKYEISDSCEDGANSANPSTPSRKYSVPPSLIPENVNEFDKSFSPHDMETSQPSSFLETCCPPITVVNNGVTGFVVEDNFAKSRCSSIFTDTQSFTNDPDLPVLSREDLSPQKRLHNSEPNELEDDDLCSPPKLMKMIDQD